ILDDPNRFLSDARAATNGTNFVVAARAEEVGNPNDIIELRWFATPNSRTPNSISVFPTAAEPQFDVALLSNGNIVVVYENKAFVADPNTISMEIFQPDGTRVFRENFVPNVSRVPNSNPQVEVLDNDFIVVAWQRDFTTESDIALKVFNQNGSLVQFPGQNEQIAVQTSSFNESAPTLEALGDGKFALAWRDSRGDGSGDRIDSRVFDITSEIASTGVGDTVVRGDGLRNLLRGSDQNDSVIGHGGNDTLFGNGGDDLLLGGPGADEIDGGAGSRDAASYQDAPSGVIVSLNNDVTSVGSDAEGDTFTSVEDLVGSNFGDILLGDGGSNIIHGLQGNDLLSGTSTLSQDPQNPPTDDGEEDVLRGGPGDDTYLVAAGSSDQPLENPNEGNDTLVVRGPFGDSALSPNIENLVLNFGLNFLPEDPVSATGNELDNNILTQNNIRVIMSGLAGNDTITGSGESDTLFGGQGNDSLAGEGGDDSLDDGEGDDFVSGGAGDDSLGQRPLFLGGSLQDLLDVNGTFVNDSRDTLVGGPGDDFYEVDSPNDVLIEEESEGLDIVYSHLDSFSLATLQNFEVLGLVGNPALSKTGTGNAESNILFAMGTDAILNGGAGDDILAGSTARFSDSLTDIGSDTLNGGDDFDIVTYNLATEGLTANLSDQSQNTGDAAGDLFLFVEGLEGTGFNDRLIGDANANLLNGSDGNDSFETRGGRDTVEGGAGTDHLSFVDQQNGVNVNIATGSAVGGVENVTFSGIENVTGTVFVDFITGDSGANRLRGLGNFDFFIGSGGGDFFDGGTGRDMVSYVNADSAVTVDLGSSRGLAGQAAGDRYVSIERITGSIHADFIIGGDGAEDFRGLGGFDTFVGSGGGRERYDGGSGRDTVSYHLSDSGVIASLLRGFGSAGDAARDLYTSIENLGGTSFNDVLTGDHDRNNLRGLFGEDVLIGNGGNDRFVGGKSNDTIFGGAGSDFAVFDGNRADYEITKTGNRDAVVSYIGSGRGDGTDTLFEVENFVFDDMTVSIFNI
ncbi:MAG: hypothetical protein MRY77_13585, partial [Rhodobacteraceae bacterium]|nr:hypothetical protein [Paracoccaceae bacterium]